MDNEKKRAKNLITMQREIICDDDDGSGKIFVSKKESADGRVNVLEFTSDKPIRKDEFLGLLIVYLENNAAELATLPTDNFLCH